MLKCIYYESESLSVVSDSFFCLTLYDRMDYTVHGILQARILEWVAFPFSRGSSQPRDWTRISCIVGGFFLCFILKVLFKYIKIEIPRWTKVFNNFKVIWILKA